MMSTTAAILRHCMLGTTMAILGMIAPSAQAQSVTQSPLLSNDFTQGEWAVLPEYCYSTQAGPFKAPGPDGDNGAPRTREWVQLMGQDFWHLHHYCWALRDLRRAEFSTDQRIRGALYMRAEGDLAYVIGTSSADMVLMPEIFLRLAELRLKVGDTAGAGQAFRRSRELKPDYWPAYTGWIDVLVGLKQFDSAKKLTVEGLQQAPASEELRKRAAKLQVSVSSAGGRRADAKP